MAEVDQKSTSPQMSPSAYHTPDNSLLCKRLIEEQLEYILISQSRMCEGCDHGNCDFINLCLFLIKRQIVLVTLYLVQLLKVERAEPKFCEVKQGNMGGDISMQISTGAERTEVASENFCKSLEVGKVVRKDHIHQMQKQHSGQSKIQRFTVRERKTYRNIMPSGHILVIPSTLKNMPSLCQQQQDTEFTNCKRNGMKGEVLEQVEKDSGVSQARGRDEGLELLSPKIREIVIKLQKYIHHHSQHPQVKGLKLIQFQSTCSMQAVNPGDENNQRIMQLPQTSEETDQFGDSKKPKYKVLEMVIKMFAILHKSSDSLMTRLEAQYQTVIEMNSHITRIEERDMLQNLIDKEMAKIKAKSSMPHSVCNEEIRGIEMNADSHHTTNAVKTAISTILSFRPSLNEYTSNMLITANLPAVDDEVAKMDNDTSWSQSKNNKEVIPGNDTDLFQIANDDEMAGTKCDQFRFAKNVARVREKCTAPRSTNDKLSSFEAKLHSLKEYGWAKVERTTVGPKGKEISIGRCRITIPEGALDEDTSIEFKIRSKLNKEAQEIPQSLLLVAPVLECSPAVTFKKPVKVSLGTWYNTKTGRIVGQMYHKKDESARWNIIGKVELGTARAINFTIHHFSNYAAMAPEELLEDGEIVLSCGAYVNHDTFNRGEMRFFACKSEEMYDEVTKYLDGNYKIGFARRKFVIEKDEEVTLQVHLLLPQKVKLTSMPDPPQFIVDRRFLLEDCAELCFFPTQDLLNGMRVQYTIPRKKGGPKKFFVSASFQPDG